MWKGKTYSRQLVDGWLDIADPENHDLIYLLRTFVLSVEQAAEDYDRYVGRCLKWLEASPADQRIRDWLLTGMIGAKRFDESIIQVLEWLSEKPSEAGLLNWLVEVLQSAKRHNEAIEIMFANLLKSGEDVSDISHIDGIGHRVVHRGQNISQPVLIDEKVLKIIENNSLKKTDC